MPLFRKGSSREKAPEHQRRRTEGEKVDGNEERTPRLKSRAAGTPRKAPSVSPSKPKKPPRKPRPKTPPQPAPAPTPPPPPPTQSAPAPAPIQPPARSQTTDTSVSVDDRHEASETGDYAVSEQLYSAGSYDQSALGDSYVELSTPTTIDIKVNGKKVTAIVRYTTEESFISEKLAKSLGIKPKEARRPRVYQDLSNKQYEAKSRIKAKIEVEGRQFDENLYVFHGKSDYMVAVGKELWDEIRPSIVEDGGYFSPQVAQPTYEYALPDRSAGDSTSYFPQARNASAQRSQYYGENYAGTGSTGHGLDPTLKQMGGRDSTLKRTGGYDTEGAYDETSPRYTLSSNMPTISPQSPRAASSAADHTNPVNAPSTPAFYQDVPQWTYQQ